MNEISDSHTSTCGVHQAVLYKNLDQLKVLVQKQELSLSCKNELQETPLLSAIHGNCSEDIIQYLVEAGSDINVWDCANRNALHLSVMYHESADVIKYLIEKGCEINLRDESGYTPLYLAVRYRSSLVSMFLYYNADVTIPNNSTLTPIIDSLTHSTTSCFDELIDYYCDDDLTRIFTKFTEQSLIFLWNNSHKEYFRTMWKYLDKKNLLKHLKMFLVYLISSTCTYETEHWLDILLIIVGSEIAEELVEDIYNDECIYLQPLLLETYIKRQIDVDTRVMLIDVFLSWGAEVHGHDIDIVLNNYGYGPEFESFIYAHCGCVEVVSNPLSYYLVNLDRNFSPTHTLQIFLRYIPTITDHYNILRMLSYFSFSQLSKNAILQRCSNNFLDVKPIADKLAAIPEFPTLMELSRNAVRCAIVQHNRISCPYKVIDIVKMFEIPEIVKNIILFRKPIY
ncbi:hypothetical protein FQA39_LY10895 [Lamprigera yunnana]|nr:hypothetical protein FQA39_LY10895 [Lamprigera yunnana]